MRKEKHKTKKKKEAREPRCRERLWCIIVHINGIIETTCAPYVSLFIYHPPQFSSSRMINHDYSRNIQGSSTPRIRGDLSQDGFLR